MGRGSGSTDSLATERLKRAGRCGKFSGVAESHLQAIASKGCVGAQLQVRDAAPVGTGCTILNSQRGRVTYYSGYVKSAALCVSLMAQRLLKKRIQEALLSM
jgi:hypothetical protein